jgi:hypothetical protein
MRTHKVFETKDDWKSFRRGLFTSSEISRLLSEPKSKADKEAGKLSDGAMTYIRERIAVLLAPEEPQYYNSQMEHGNETEPQAVMAYATKIGKSVNDEDFIYTSVGGFVFFTDEEYSAGGTPDIIIGKTIVEIKCPASKTHLEYLMFETVEDFQKSCPNYYAQMQMNMWLCDAASGVFVSYDDRYYNESHHLFTLDIPRDEPFIENLKSKLLKAKEIKDNIINKYQPLTK